MRVIIALVAAVGAGLILAAVLARVLVPPPREPTRGEREAEEVIRRAWRRSSA